jgi:hypothetical protein
VQLVAFRGNEQVHAPARRPLDFTLDETGVQANAPRLDVVNASGDLIWTGQAAPMHDKLSARVPKGLSPGTYWVRLFDGNVLVREFGLRLE